MSQLSFLPPKFKLQEWNNQRGTWKEIALGKHSPPDTAHCFGLTLFSPRNSSSFYLWMVCTYSPPETAHLEKPGTYYFGILLPKLFWPTVRKNCSSDREKLLKFEAESREFSKFLRSIYSNSERSEQFLVTECFFNLFLEVCHI